MLFKQSKHALNIDSNSHKKNTKTQKVLKRQKTAQKNMFLHLYSQLFTLSVASYSDSRPPVNFVKNREIFNSH